MKMDKLFEKIKSAGIRKELDNRQTIFSDGDKANGFYYVESGRVRAFKMDASGKDFEVSSFNAGEYFGEVIVFGAEAYPVHTETVGPAVVYYFDKKQVLSLIKKNPSTAMSFLTILAKKCISLNKQIENLTLKTVRMRLIQFLVNNCGREEDCVVHLQIKKSELARKIGTVSETLSRNFAHLQNDGLIQVRNRDIKVLDCKKMKAELDD